MEEHLRKIEHFLLEEYDVEVDYDSSYEDSYYHESGLIEMNSSQALESCLCGLLHEAGHAALGHRLTTPHLPHQSVIDMELSAWHFGKKIASALSIPIPLSYDKECRISIEKYKTHFKGEGA